MTARETVNANTAADAPSLATVSDSAAAAAAAATTPPENDATVTAPGSPATAAHGTESGRLIQQFRETRARTLSMTSTLEPDDFVVQTAPYTSPIKWHIGHVSWIHEAIMGKVDGEFGFERGRVSEYLNSYYQQFGTPHDKASRGAISRPTTSQMLEYFETVSGKVEKFIARHADSIDAPASSSQQRQSKTARLIEIAIHHECQHQELMVYDLQHMLADQYKPNGNNRTPAPPKRDPLAAGRNGAGEQQVRIEGGMYLLGYGGNGGGGENGYCYDIELPEHAVYLSPYLMDAYPVTNGQYMEFIMDGGYHTYKYWLADGWGKVKENGWEAPMYWERGDGGATKGGDASWKIRDFAGRRAVNPLEPVCHISYYEADAYARWAGKRLPTEAEWEKAACWNDAAQKKTAYPWGNETPTPDRCNLLESGHWQCAETGAYPEGASAYGCHQMIGDVWEWTASEFVGYPGFASGFDEYNDKWFANQKVLRGGSFGTPAISIRASYRNFFRLEERWMISGLRCAQDTE